MELGGGWANRSSATVGLARIKVIPMVWQVFDIAEHLFLDKGLELKGSFCSFILSCIVTNIKFGGFSPILAS
jgi:hypothetical protein